MHYAINNTIRSCNTDIRHQPFYDYVLVKYYTGINGAINERIIYTVESQVSEFT